MDNASVLNIKALPVGLQLAAERVLHVSCHSSGECRDQRELWKHIARGPNISLSVSMTCNISLQVIVLMNGRQQELKRK